MADVKVALPSSLTAEWIAPAEAGGRGVIGLFFGEHIIGFIGIPEGYNAEVPMARVAVDRIASTFLAERLFGTGEERWKARV
jgi:hypothetical protein